MELSSLDIVRAEPGEGYFEDDSLIRIVNNELVVAFSGGRALLMQAAHPVMFEGFYQKSSSISDVHGRLRRTAFVMNTIYYGTRDEADRLTGRVRQMHKHVRGTLVEPAGDFPAGTPYAADDPKYLLWTLATLFSSADMFYNRYVHRLSIDERDRLWDDYCLVGTLFGLGLGDLPPTAKDCDDYVTMMERELYVTERAREVAPAVVLHPPLPFYFRPLVDTVNFAVIGSLPAAVRRGYGFTWPAGASLAWSLGAFYTHLTWPRLPGLIRNTPLAGGRAIPLG